MQPSNEQMNILGAVGDKKHIVVSAAAGSGKTTSVLFIAEQNKHKKIVQITYNKSLKIEVRKKVEERNITNLGIHTYHSFCLKYYDDACHNDDCIIKILEKDNEPKSIGKFDILIVDEVQDMTLNYYNIICKTVRDMKLENSLFIALGDRYQGIYGFKNADTRFLTMGDKLYPRLFKNKECVFLPLSQSYRITNQMASFINEVMVGGNRIISEKQGDPVYYYRMKMFGIENTISKMVMYYLAQKYRPEDIFILVPSVKSKTIKKIENLLVKNNVYVYYPSNDNNELDDDILKNKLVFSSFHQSKGRERKIVFVFNFDNSYLKYYNRSANPNECPNELYVAATRASEKLILINDSSNEILPFFKKSYEEMQKLDYIKFIGSTAQTKKKEEEKKEDEKENYHETTVTNLVKFLDEQIATKIAALLNKIYIKRQTIDIKKNVNLKNSIKINKRISEDVSNINGIAIVDMYSKQKSGNTFISRKINKYCENMKESEHDYIYNFYTNNKETYKKDKIGYELFKTNIYIAIIDNLYHKLNQIKKYNWVKEKELKLCYRNLNEVINGKTEFEIPINTNFEHAKYGEIQINGQIDCIDGQNIYELKCVSELTNEHKLQLLTYIWMIMNSDNKYKKHKFILYNFKTTEKYELVYKDEIVDMVIELLLQNRYDTKKEKTDKEFLEYALEKK